MNVLFAHLNVINVTYVRFVHSWRLLWSYYVYIRSLAFTCVDLRLHTFIANDLRLLRMTYVYCVYHEWGLTQVNVRLFERTFICVHLRYTMCFLKMLLKIDFSLMNVTNSQ